MSELIRADQAQIDSTCRSAISKVTEVLTQLEKLQSVYQSVAPTWKGYSATELGKAITQILGFGDDLCTSAYMLTDTIQAIKENIVAGDNKTASLIN